MVVFLSSLSLSLFYISILFQFFFSLSRSRLLLVLHTFFILFFRCIYLSIYTCSFFLWTIVTSASQQPAHCCKKTRNKWVSELASGSGSRGNCADELRGCAPDVSIKSGGTQPRGDIDIITSCQISARRELSFPFHSVTWFDDNERDRNRKNIYYILYYRMKHSERIFLN